jgi:hypothetical protein
MMDAVRKLIDDRITDLGLSYKGVSLTIGRNETYIQQFLKKGHPAQLFERERKLLSELLKVPEDALRGPSQPLMSREYSRSGADTAGVKKMSGTVQSLVDKLSNTGQQLYGDRDDLPVYGIAQGVGGCLVITNDAVKWVVRPAPLLRVRDGYGIIVTGHSMAPKFENGSTALVNPHIPYEIGDTCVFRHRQDDGTVLIQIRELRKFNDETWFVRQYKPERDFSLKRSEWRDCHVTVGSYFSR